MRCTPVDTSKGLSDSHGERGRRITANDCVQISQGCALPESLMLVVLKRTAEKKSAHDQFETEVLWCDKRLQGERSVEKYIRIASINGISRRVTPYPS